MDTILTMGAWSGEPFGNDSAADWAWELDDESSWGLVNATLASVADATGPVDEDAAGLAIAAAEVVAHGLGRPTQQDAYTESVEAFVARAGTPTAELTALALRALAVATERTSELAELWAESEDADEWATANEKIRTALEA